MRLKSQHNSPAMPSLTNGFESRGNLRRMMTVVVDDGYATIGCVDIAILLQAPIDTLESGERALYGGFIDIEFGGHGNGRQRIEYVVRSRQV
jgi:hypothetical protein